jgi:hypothetical protein
MTQNLANLGSYDYFFISIFFALSQRYQSLIGRSGCGKGNARILSPTAHRLRFP